MGAQVAVDPESSVEDYLNRWLAHMKGRVRPKTHEGYQGMIRLYVGPTLGEMPLDRLGPMQVQDLYASLLARGLSGGTVLNLHLALTNAFGQAAHVLLGLSATSHGAPCQESPDA
jgi:hypothetical protein